MGSNPIPSTSFTDLKSNKNKIKPMTTTQIDISNHDGRSNDDRLPLQYFGFYYSKVKILCQIGDNFYLKYHLPHKFVLILMLEEVCLRGF